MQGVSADKTDSSQSNNSNETDPVLEEEEEHEEVHELLKVYLSRSDIPPEEIAPGEFA